MKNININIERLMETFTISNQIGKVKQTGVRRLTLSPEDKVMRDIFCSWLEAADLTVRVDDFGNIYGRRAGLREDLAPVTLGSHLDTQPYGGRYDGILGVLSALEIIKVLNEHQIETIRPIEIINFTNEEGCRFNATSGSEGLTGVSSKEKLYQDTDKDGVTFEAALKNTGYLGKQENRLKNAHSYVELHIEQGPTLDQKNKDIGIVQGDVGSEELEIIVTGETGHSTATPMEVRKDAMIKAAEIIVAAQNLTLKHGGTLTVGNLETYPVGFHIISKVHIPMIVLHEDLTVREQLLTDIKQVAYELAAENKMDIQIDEALFKASTAYFSDSIKAIIHKQANNLNYSTFEIDSKGFHDANNMNKITKAAMIFIPCKDGISHNTTEFATEEHIEKGANVLLQTVLTLSQMEKDIK